MNVRLANIEDLNGIMEVEKGVYGRIGTEVTATERVMKERIKNSPGWFWIAEDKDQIRGFLSLQPTEKGPQEFKNWDKSTDNGTLRRTFDPAGKYVYGVALTVNNGDVGGSIPAALFIRAAQKIIKENKKLAYFSARIPSYHKYKDRFSPEQYCEEKIVRNGRAVSLDPQIRFYESYGFTKSRIVPAGYPDDWQSAGYGVIFVYENKFHERQIRNLVSIASDCLLRMNLTEMLLRFLG